MKAFNSDAPQIEKIKIEWHEGTGQYDGRTFTNWESLQHAFNRIYKHHIIDLVPGTYTKVKVQLFLSDGNQPFARIDVGDNDYTPHKETIREHLEAFVEKYFTPVA